MTITLTGAVRAPHWKTLQKAIVQALDTDGRLTRISRNDGRCDYTAKGAYTLTFTPRDYGDEVIIKLVVG